MLTRPVRSVVKLMAAVALVAGCATTAMRPPSPTPGAPRILRAEAVPYVAPSGCPVTLRLAFEDPEADVVSGTADWSIRTSGRFLHQGSSMLTLGPDAVSGVRRGEVEIQLMPPHSGRLHYRIQLEDAGGRMSNVAVVEFYRELQPFWAGRPACSAVDPGPGEPSAP